MKGKQLAAILVLLVSLGALALFLQRKNAAGWSDGAARSNEKVLSFALNDVSQIALKDAAGEVELHKRDGVWTVGERADYPADFDKIARLIKKLWELRAGQEMKIGSSQLGRLQLLEPGSGANAGMFIDLKDAGGKRLGALVLGKKQMPESEAGGGMSSGRYVIAPEQGDRALLLTETFDEIQAKPEQWLKRDFVAIENPKSIALSSATAPARNWKISRENNAPWKLENGKANEELDSEITNTLTSYLNTMGFADVMAPNPSPAAGLDKPSVVKVETADDFNYEFKVGKLTGSNYPVTVSVKANLPNERKAAPDEKPENKAKLDQEFQATQTKLKEKLAREERLAGRTYLFARTTMDQFLKDRAALLKPAATPTPTPRAK